MTAKRGTNNANGVISFFVFACGITFSALIGCLLKKATENVSDMWESGMAYGSAPLWCFGFAYVIPGLLGFISAFIKNKGLWITQMVFGIISLLVMGIFFIFAIVGLDLMITDRPSLSECYDVNGKCNCMGSGDMDFSCEDINAMYAMGLSTLLIIALAWILLLVTTVLAGVLGCSYEPQPGVILRPPTTTVVQLSPVAGMPPNLVYMPQTQPQVHDQAQLVHNMEY